MHSEIEANNHQFEGSFAQSCPPGTGAACPTDGSASRLDHIRAEGHGSFCPILLENSLLRSHCAIIEAAEPASRIRYSALWLVLESMLRVGNLANRFATISARLGHGDVNRLSL